MTKSGYIKVEIKKVVYDKFKKMAKEHDTTVPKMIAHMVYEE